MIETVFYILASIALLLHLLEKVVEIALDYREVKSAFRIKKMMNKVRK